MTHKLPTITALLLVSTICATATPITWTLQDVQFSSGPVTGSFLYDADLNPGDTEEAGIIISADLMSPDGLTYNDVFGFFTSTVPHLIVSTPNNGINLTGSSWLWIDPNGYLTDAGGSVPIKEAEELLCISPGCESSITAATFSGELVAQSSQPSAPEPSAALLGAFGLLAIYGFVLRKQKGDGKNASN